MSFVVVALLISAVWLVGFGLYISLSRQQKTIEKEIEALATLLEKQEK